MSKSENKSGKCKHCNMAQNTCDQKKPECDKKTCNK